MLSVQHVLEILCDNNRLPNQLLLSSEICLFEVVTIKFDEIPMKSNGIRMKSLDCCKHFHSWLLRADQLYEPN